MSKNKRFLANHISENRYFYFLAAFFIAAGVIFGAFKGAAANSGIDCVSAFKLHGAAFSQILFQSMFSNFRVIVLLWISGLLVWLYPINASVLLSKAFGIGYTIAVFISCLGVKGFFIASAALIVQNLLIIPIIMIYSVIQLKFSMSYSKIKSTASAYKQKKQYITRSIVTLLIFLIAVFLCSLCEALLIPKLISIF